MTAGDRSLSQTTTVPVPSVNIDSSGDAVVDLNRSAACPVEPMVMSASAGDVRLELRSAVGSLLEGTSLYGGPLGSSDEEVFLAAWEKQAANDGRGRRTAVGDRERSSIQSPSDLSLAGGDPGDLPAERPMAR